MIWDGDKHANTPLTPASLMVPSAVLMFPRATAAAFCCASMSASSCWRTLAVLSRAAQKTSKQHGVYTIVRFSVLESHVQERCVVQRVFSSAYGLNRQHLTGSSCLGGWCPCCSLLSNNKQKIALFFLFDDRTNLSLLACSITHKKETKCVHPIAAAFHRLPERKCVTARKEKPPVRN